jgi:hypothetical protein
MNKALIFISFILSSSAYGQSENNSQPDSMFKNRHVRKIILYENSPKDLSMITFVDKEGRKIRSIFYSASYNGKTRKNKRIERTKHFKYESNKLVQIIDSTAYFDGTFSVDNTFFYYDSLGRLTKSLEYQRNFKTPLFETTYRYNPYESTTIKHKDTLITYHKTKEYENGFYVKRFYGYYLEFKLKDRFVVQGKDTIIYSYSDENDLQKFNDNEVLKNSFNAAGQIVSSDINSVFMNDRTTNYKLTYNYYPNGLLKSVRGYIPEFFEYEFYK